MSSLIIRFIFPTAKICSIKRTGVFFSLSIGCAVNVKMKLLLSLFISLRVLSLSLFFHFSSLSSVWDDFYNHHKSSRAILKRNECALNTNAKTEKEGKMKKKEIIRTQNILIDYNCLYPKFHAISSYLIVCVCLFHQQELNECTGEWVFGIHLYASIAEWRVKCVWHKMKKIMKLTNKNNNKSC